MSVSFEKIFTETTVLQSYVLKINDYEMLDEDILSFEVIFDFSKPFIEGVLVIKDSFGIADLNIFDGNTTINIYANDIFDKKFVKTFRITSVSNDEYNDRFKTYSLKLVDELYYTLANTYLSKSFSSNPITAFEDYLFELDLDTYIIDNNMTYNFDEIEDSYSFVVPQDRSILEFFLYELNNQGYRVWQDRNSINIKRITFKDLEYTQINGENISYTNDTSNPNYAFKIHDFKLNYNNILTSNLIQPILEHQAFDITKKVMDTQSKNLIDVYTDIKLNDKDMSKLQHTTGKKIDIDVEVFINKQKLDIEDAYFNNNTIEIVVPGNFKYNNIGLLVDIQLKGNPIMNIQALEGDRFHSGTYFISKMSDRYIGNKLIQKLTLNRIDFQEPRNL